MTRLCYTEDLYQLLSRIGNGFVMWHDGTEVHCPGFSWQQSDMSWPIQELCSDALHAQLISLGHHEPWGSAVSLTGAGEAHLTALREQRNQAVRGAA